MRRTASLRARCRDHGNVIVMLAAAALAIVALLAPGSAAAQSFPYQDPSLPVATRVNDLLGRMTLDEKIGQMT